ncbi:MAG: hypothetical protein K2X47_04745 [Bdellovibrionales bacterium]|nr:hypothetical protein [Bdellovibrionales bacterium]
MPKYIDGKCVPRLVSIFLCSVFCHQASAKCDLDTIPKWQKYLQERTELPIAKNWNTVAEKVAQCSAEILRLRVEPCVQNLSGFATAQALQNGSNRHYKFLMKDRDYFASRPRVAVTLPEEFRLGLPSQEKWPEIVKRYDGILLQYSSTSVDNPAGDFSSALRLKFGQLGLSSRKRTLFFLRNVGGGGFDQFIQFTNAENPKDPARLIDVITVQRGEPEPQLHFIQYWRRKPNTAPDIRPQRYKEKACYECHASGLREIHPWYGSVAQEDMPSLKRLNEVIRGYGKTGWAGAYKPEMNGPPRGGTEGLNNCASCHNGIIRGALNANFNLTQIYHKMFEVFHMPPGITDRKEYGALVEAIQKKNELIEEKILPAARDQEPLTPTLMALQDRMSSETLAQAMTLSKELDEAFKDMTVGYEKKLQEWLRGPKGCFEEALQAAADQRRLEKNASQPDPTNSRAPAFNEIPFGDRDLQQTVSGAEKPILFYLWSPRMNLSVKGLGEIFKIGQDMGYQTIALRDPTISLEETLSLFEDGEVSSSEAWLRPNHSQRIRKELGAIHYPTILIHSRGEFMPQSLRGYDDPETIQAILGEWVGGQKK